MLSRQRVSKAVQQLGITSVPEQVVDRVLDDVLKREARLLIVGKLLQATVLLHVERDSESLRPAPRLAGAPSRHITNLHQNHTSGF